MGLTALDALYVSLADLGIALGEQLWFLSAQATTSVVQGLREKAIQVNPKRIKEVDEVLRAILEVAELSAIQTELKEILAILKKAPVAESLPLDVGKHVIAILKALASDAESEKAFQELLEKPEALKGLFDKVAIQTQLRVATERIETVLVSLEEFRAEIKDAVTDWVKGEDEKPEGQRQVPAGEALEVLRQEIEALTPETLPISRKILRDALASNPAALRHAEAILETVVNRRQPSPG